MCRATSSALEEWDLTLTEGEKKDPSHPKSIQETMQDLQRKGCSK